MKTAETAKTTKTHKQDSLHQFGYFPVLGINILNRLVPIRGSILLGANRVKTGIFFAGMKPDACFMRKECFHCELTRKDLIGYINWYRDDFCEFTDCDGEKHTPKWQEHIERCGRVKDSCNRPLSITTSKKWWTGTTYYQPNIMLTPDSRTYNYPECCYEPIPRRGKDGERKFRAKDNACVGNERRI